jgi:hypothetical protein
MCRGRAIAAAVVTCGMTTMKNAWRRTDVRAIAALAPPAKMCMVIVWMSSLPALG